MTLPKIAVSAVVIARNEEGNIRRCIKSLLDQSVPVGEIIVVDGNSTDHTLRYAADIARASDRIRITLQDPDSFSEGPCAARNTGAELASGDLVLFVNGDVTIESDYLAEMLTTLNAQELDAVSGQKWNVRTSLVSGLMNVDCALNYSDSLTEQNLLSTFYDDALLVRATAFWKVGGFDPQVPVNGGSELVYRLLGSGYRIGSCKRATIWHEGRHQRSFGEWIEHMQLQGASTSTLIQYGNSECLLKREEIDFYRNVITPASMAIASLWIGAVLVSAIGALALGLLAVLCVIGGIKYLRSATEAQTRIAAVPLPTTPLPVDLLLYPMLKFTQAVMLSFFTWQSLRSVPVVAVKNDEQEPQAEDEAA